MAALTPFYITGFNKGLTTNKKPFLLPNQAWSTLFNEYVWRDRVLKREGNKLLGRLQRNLTGQALGTTSAGVTTITITDAFNTLSLRATEPNAEFKSGSLVITIAAPDAATFTDLGTGVFSVTGKGVAAGSYVDYATGKVVLIISSSTGGAAITGVFSYYPSLPGMGIWQREQSIINQQQTVWWDTKYAYIYTGGLFQEFITGTTWNGNNSDFFWAYNYQAGASSRLLFVTNFNNTQNGEATPDPMRYTDGSTWTTFAPLVDATHTMYQAKILIPYWGRLIALNVFEGVTASGQAAATNYFTRCRFSALGDPTLADSWRSDTFGKGGFIDAPTNEAITGATFVKNTLIVDFEYSTWQLRYVGEYGLPFVWERVSSDFGSGSTFSGVLFDNHRLNIGDVAITAGNAIGVDRIDLDIPDKIFDFQNNQTNRGAARVWGIRDYQRDLVFWNYPDAQSQSVAGTAITFPNKVLLYNYRNATWAVFRDNVTCFGVFQLQTAVTWDSTTVTWDDEKVTWDDDINQIGFPSVCKANQQGYVHLFGYTVQDDASLSVTGITLTSGTLRLTVPNHNLFTGECIYLTGMEFIDSTTFAPVTTDLNGVIYNVQQVIDANTIVISKWNSTQKIYVTNFTYTPVLANSIYVGGGQLALFPIPDLVSKDINLFQNKGLQNKLSRIDFLLEPQSYDTAVTINILPDGYAIQDEEDNDGDAEVLDSLPYYTAEMSIQAPNGNAQNSEYYWFSHHQTVACQYFKIQITYDEDLINTLTTHQSNLTLYAINAFVRPGARMTRN